MADEIKGMKCIENRDPDETSPAKVVASSIKCNIQRVEVSSFPVIKFEEVDSLENGAGKVAFIKTVELVTSEEVNDDKPLPEHQSNPTICQLLNVHT